MLNGMNPDDQIEENFRLTKSQKQALKKLGLETIYDLLFHFPSRYGEVMEAKYISNLALGDNVVIRGRISKIEKTRAFKKKIPFTRAVIEDATGKLRVIWFNQPYIAKMIHEGSYISLKGKITQDKKGFYIANPTSENDSSPYSALQDTLLNKKKALNPASPTSQGGPTAQLQSIYPESRGITSLWFFYAIKKLLATETHKKISDYIPEKILKKYNLPALQTALIWIHQPRKISDEESARKRFAFEEIFFIQLTRQKAKRIYQNHPSFNIPDSMRQTRVFTKRFPFKFTDSQEKAISRVFEDFQKEKPMSRLLEGDVGSGKTAVAATTAHRVATSRPSGQDFGNLQVAIMAPTEILAKQHFESFINYFSNLPIQIGLITSSGCKKFPSKINPDEATDISRTQLLKWIASGEIPILIGTHSLIQKSVEFKDLAYVIIDEQHRFGTMQRYKLASKSKEERERTSLAKSMRVPHLLSMTATPIPRTLALTIYGDLDLTLLTQMPPGRKPIITEIVLKHRRNETYEKVRKELEAGRQVYVICPRIDEPDPKKQLALIAKSVKEEAVRLKKDVFPEYEIEILHSKMRPKERDEIMGRFTDGEIHILVATSVIEVGVNVENATTIIIEGAERFGLAQLHQLRGRVLRSNHQAYCYIFSDTKSIKSLERLTALKQATNGFDLAELDLKLRGAGELAGKKQWGISDLGMEAIKNIKMVEAARAEAEKLLDEDVELKNHPLIKEKLAQNTSEIHFE